MMKGCLQLLLSFLRPSVRKECEHLQKLRQQKDKGRLVKQQLLSGPHKTIYIAWRSKSRLASFQESLYSLSDLQIPLSLRPAAMICAQLSLSRSQRYYIVKFSQILLSYGSSANWVAQLSNCRKEIRLAQGYWLSTQLSSQYKNFLHYLGLANQPHLATSTYQEDECSSSTGQIAQHNEHTQRILLKNTTIIGTVAQHDMCAQ